MVIIVCDFTFGDFWETAVLCSEGGMEHHKNFILCGDFSIGVDYAGGGRFDVCGIAGIGDRRNRGFPDGKTLRGRTAG